MAIIKSMIDTDIYKLNMLMAFLQLGFGDLTGRYVFQCRSKPNYPLGFFLPHINAELDALCDLKFRPNEIGWLRSQGFPEWFLKFLKGFQLDRNSIHVDTLDNGDLSIEAVGKISHVMLFEIYILIIVNQLYFSQFTPDLCIREGDMRLEEKFNYVIKNADPDFQFLDFGTRRRFSGQWHRYALEKTIKKIPQHLAGTSNMLMAMIFGIPCKGTMAHEYLQSFQAFVPNLRDFQKEALKKWLEVFPDKNKIALSDVIGIDAFLEDFDHELASAYDGVRQDSGDPREVGNKVLDHYQKLGIDSKEKIFVPSDGLDFPHAIIYHKHFKGRIKTLPGIGTNYTNDMGPRALQIVMKMVECDGKTVVKISDDAGKSMPQVPQIIEAKNRLVETFNLKNG